MNIHVLCKRYYTNKDLLKDRFGRLYHLPVQLSRLGAKVTVTAIDYRNPRVFSLEAGDVTFRTAPATFGRLPRLVPTLYREIRRSQPDVLIASGDSHIGYLGLRIARKLGARFVFDVYDYYPVFPGNRIPGMKAMFRNAVRHADLVLGASDPLVQRLAPANPRTILIENGVDRSFFKPGNKEEARSSLGLSTTGPIIGFFGSVAPSKGPLLIVACGILAESWPSLRLLLAGRVSGVDIDRPWIRYFGELEQREIPQLIAACDVVVVPLAHDPQNDLSGACKIAEYLACGKPVVATRLAGHEGIFRTTPDSICEPDPTDMARAIKTQLEYPKSTRFPEKMAWEWIGARLYHAVKHLGT